MAMKRIRAVISATVTTAVLTACGSGAKVRMENEQVATRAPAPVTTTTTTLPSTTTTGVITEIMTAAEVSPPPSPAERITTTTTTPPCANPEGLYCLPFAPPGLDNCQEFMFYVTQQGQPAERLSDQPRTGPKRSQGIGWRESNCQNDANSHWTSTCCLGYFQIDASNINAPGYKAAGVFVNCGITSKWDYYGLEPLQKQKSVCAAFGMYWYHANQGQDALWEVWDKWL